MKKGDIRKFEIEGYAYEGKGISKISDEENTEKKFVVFVNGSYPGDTVEAQIIKKKKSYADAKTLNVITKSDKRTEPVCSYFGTCGGCKQQDLKYSEQLYYKQEQVKDIFQRIGGFQHLVMEPIVASENIIYYRNKLEFSFADRRWLTKAEIGDDASINDRNFALGFHIPRIFDKVLDIHECFLQSKISNDILNFTREFFKNRETPIYSTKTHEGYLRNLVIKQSQHANDLMVNLVTSDENDDLMKQYSSELQNRFPEISTIINNINQKKSQVAIGDYEKIFFGSGLINDHIGKYKFQISANSFFQTNTVQAENLYNTALEYAEIKENDIVYDLYAGAGTISIYMSDKAKHVYAFESVEPAVRDAQKNNELNSVKNVSYFLADLNKSFLPILSHFKIPKPNIIILDPPRSGMNPKTVKDLLSLKPEKIVYVSCNPATQARDIQLLCENEYELIKIKPVDMFPHTFHIENVASLRLKK
ncbi:MAG: 23S rRNA (uracil(1939)-C(5))-methyltransferase RlmD [Bacteroidetes bacterium]|nr:23S rRNA (uracil(1939)-C(5))-methyltransferase RlmD [Bacteroidota bacterium]